MTQIQPLAECPPYSHLDVLTGSVLVLELRPDGIAVKHHAAQDLLVKRLRSNQVWIRPDVLLVPALDDIGRVIDHQLLDLMINLAPLLRIFHCRSIVQQAVNLNIAVPGRI